MRDVSLNHPEAIRCGTLGGRAGPLRDGPKGLDELGFPTSPFAGSGLLEPPHTAAASTVTSRKPIA